MVCKLAYKAECFSQNFNACHMPIWEKKEKWENIFSFFIRKPSCKASVCLTMCA